MAGHSHHSIQESMEQERIEFIPFQLHDPFAKRTGGNKSVCCIQISAGGEVKEEAEHKNNFFRTIQL